MPTRNRTYRHRLGIPWLGPGLGSLIFYWPEKMAHRILDGSQWLAILHRPEPSSLDVRLVNLVGFDVFSCSATHDEVRRQLQEASIDTAVDEMLGLLLSAFNGSAPKQQLAFHEFRVQAREHSSAALQWLIKQDVKLSFRCAADVRPAARLGEELVLPLLRATLQLRQLVAAEPAAALWHAPAGQPLPLPDLTCEPLISKILQHAGPTGLCCDASSASASALVGADALGGAGAVATKAPAAAASAAVAPPASVRASPLPSPTADEERKRKVREEREEKAAKAKMKAAKAKM